MRLLRDGALPGRHTARGRPIVIQRLTSRAQLLQDTDSANADFQAVGALLDQYNVATNASPQNTARLNNRFTLLRQIDRRIYQWFDTVSQANLRLSSNAHTARMQALLTETESEFINLVDQTKHNANVFPFDLASVPGPQRNDVKALWRSLVAGSGKIKLVGTPAHQRKSLAELAKLLNTASSRKLLKYLNTPTATAALADPLTNIYIGDDVNLLNPGIKNVSPDLADRNQSEALPLGNGAHALGPPQQLDGSEDMVNDFVRLNSPADFRTAVLKGKRGVVLNNHKYLFSGGTGAFVKTIADGGTGVGQNIEEIAKAGFVTLGHELGHAAHMRGGATTMPTGIDHRFEFMEAFSGVNPTETKLLWDNSEEFLNITNTENPIRAGAQMSLTGAHKTQGAILRTRRFDQINAIILPLGNLDPFVINLPVYRAVEDQLLNRKGELHNDAFFNSLLAMANQLAGVINPGYIQTEKERSLKREFRAMDLAVAASNALSRVARARNMYLRISHEMQHNLNAYTAAGQYALFRQLRNDIRALKLL